MESNKALGSRTRCKVAIDISGKGMLCHET